MCCWVGLVCLSFNPTRIIENLNAKAKSSIRSGVRNIEWNQTVNEFIHFMAKTGRPFIWFPVVHSQASSDSSEQVNSVVASRQASAIVIEECFCIIFSCQHLWWLVPKLWRWHLAHPVADRELLQMERILWRPWKRKPKPNHHLWNRWRLWRLHRRTEPWQWRHVPKARQSRGQPLPLPPPRSWINKKMTMPLTQARKTLPTSQQQRHQVTMMRRRMGNHDLQLVVLTSTRMLHRHHHHLCWVAATGTKRRHSMGWFGWKELMVHR